MTVYTLYGGSGGGSVNSFTGTLCFGLEFSVSSPVPLTGIWWYSPATAAGLPNWIGLFTVSGTTLVTSNSSPSWSGAAGSGWIKATFSSAPSLSSGVAYKAAASNNAGTTWYSQTANYFSTGPGGSGLTSGPISAPNHAAASTGQMSFVSTAATYPNVSTADNFWLDVEVTTGGASPSGLLMAGIV